MVYGIILQPLRGKGLYYLQISTGDDYGYWENWQLGKADTLRRRVSKIMRQDVREARNRKFSRRRLIQE